MEEAEFEVLDELYFVISYSDLLNSVDLEEDVLQRVLLQLLDKEWIRVYRNEEEVEKPDLKNNFKSYFYLASKKGLFAHNRQ